LTVSGEVPQEPVVSKNSGFLFEKRLIDKYIKDHGKCPVTGEALSAEDLLPVQANKALRPRPVSGTSIPGLLVAFQVIPM
jgi:pre-mRNA-processing factor 19